MWPEQHSSPSSPEASTQERQLTWRDIIERIREKKSLGQKLNERQYLLLRCVEIQEFFDRGYEELRTSSNEYYDLEHAKHHGFSIPLREKSNLLFDAPSNSYILGPKRIIRSTRNVDDLIPLMRMNRMNDLVMELLVEEKTMTLREVFYKAQNWDTEWKACLARLGRPQPKDGEKLQFTTQQQCDDLITDMESVYGIPHESWGIWPQGRGHIYGEIEIAYTQPAKAFGRRIRLDTAPDGLTMGPALSTAELLSCNATCIIISEKESIMRRFLEERVNEKYRAVLVDTGGAGPTAMKLLVRRLAEKFNLEIYIVNDADPWGLHIARALIVGSASGAHLRMNFPKARFLGMTPRDIIEYDLPSNPLTSKDLLRVEQLLGDPRYADPAWRKHLLDYRANKRKAELQAFAEHGITYVVDRYLPEKMAAA